ncbi:hypothetical protein [Amycolatopsis keratiniphila]|uniref:ARB-07466-like C-terminal domain-containing protein n=1 Tax=Amycolatopsis keratiniphila subsp. keratiniphila TaxID=227715 RepID=A0A1W2LUW7_9PSEU|nr:hypothetical protein [Amycolatopsis keratiniphila]OLZ58264.1 hypothetical protein BS330_11825 [Amycolatopsis keratiniphila subsp. nogabecina]ONF69913.1 hypothetical protein AVR91_0216720 [Amycolatopsis keratiniphila subsp. keratiniphila]SDU29230.1 hypothetical protein SAMN04489733_2771 [Amycolatopsis keratiniphila]
MAGRHRKIKAPQWKLPAGIAAAVATALPASMWLTSAGSPDVEAASAALALKAPPVSSVTPPPSTSSTPPSSSTTTPPPSTSSAPPKPTTSTKAPAPVKKTVPAATACSTSLAGTKPHVAQVGNHVKAKFGVKNVGGVAGRANASDHPSGLALDFMVDTATGNAIAEYLMANQKDFGITYVIWRQRYNDGSGWDTMEDRGGATANHMDHVHVSFAKSAKVNVSC